MSFTEINNRFTNKNAVDEFYRITGNDDLHVTPKYVLFLACIYDEERDETVYVQANVPVSREEFLNGHLQEGVASNLIKAAKTRGVNPSAVVMFNSILHPEQANAFKHRIT